MFRRDNIDGKYKLAQMENTISGFHFSSFGHNNSRAEYCASTLKAFLFCDWRIFLGLRRLCLSFRFLNPKNEFCMYHHTKWYLMSANALREKKTACKKIPRGNSVRSPFFFFFGVPWQVAGSKWQVASGSEDEPPYLQEDQKTGENKFDGV